MNIGVVFGMTMVSLLDVVRVQFRKAYDAPASDSLEYVFLVLFGLLLLFAAFPEWSC